MSPPRDRLRALAETDSRTYSIDGIRGPLLLLELEVEAGATVADVIVRSRIAAEFPGFDIDALETGVWGRIVTRDQPVRDGDRVELYRPLQLDPREARRKQALAGRTMGQAPGGEAPTDWD